MKRINVYVNSVLRWSAYKRESEYQAWIDAAVAANLWGLPGEYTVEVLDATAEIESNRQQAEGLSKQSAEATFEPKNANIQSHVSSTENPHSVTKAQIGLASVDDVSAASLRDRSTHTGTQLSSTISDFDEAAQDAIGNSLVDSADIDFTYPDPQNQITAELTATGVTPGSYSLVSVDSKGRVTAGSNSGSVTRYSTINGATATNSNATYTTVASLTTVSLPVGLYKISFRGRGQSGSTTNGTGVRLSNGTATISTINITWAIAQGANGVSQKFQFDQIAANTNVTSASAAAANTDFGISGEGIVRITVAGTLLIQLRSELNGTASSLLADSCLEVTLV
jgi:hypothetical protein